MEIVIAILFSTVISMGVSLYFRMLNKKDDPLERINKFANKKTNELNEAFAKIQTRFSTIISDFNAQQTQANAAVKLLKQQNEEFNAKMQTFDQSINAVKNIKSQIDAYSKILGELNDMTAQVEENLERLHKESGVISAIDGRLSKQQNQLAAIEKKIPEISKEFSTHNAEQLKAVGTTLIENYEARAAKLTADIKTSQGDAEKALSEIKQSIQEAYNHATVSAEKLENTAFEHLSEQAQQRTDKYLKELGEQTASLQSELEKQTLAIRNDITNRTNIIHAELETKEKELIKMFDDKTAAATASYKESENKLLTDAKANLIKINEKFNEKLGQLSESFAGKVDALQTKYNQQLETIGGRNDGLIGKIQARFNEDSNKLEAEYTKQMESIQKKNEGNYSALENKFADDFKKFQETYAVAFDNATATNNNKVNEFNRLFVEEHKKFAEEHEKLIQDFSAALNESQSANDRKLAEFKGAQDEQLQSLNEIYNSEYTKIKEEYLGRFEGLQDEYSQQIEGLQNVFGNRIEELSNTEEDYKARIENLRTQLETSLRQCNERSSTLQTEITDMQEKLSETLRQVATEASSSVENAEASVQAIKTQCDEAERRAATLKPELEEQISKMNTSLETVQNETMQKLEKLQSATENQIESIQKETASKIESLQNSSDSQIEEIQKDTSLKLEQIQTSTDRQLEGFKGDTSARLDNFQNETNTRLEGLTKIITDSVRKAVSESEVKHLNILENVDNQLNAYKKDIEYKLSQIQVSESDIDTLEKSLKAAMVEVQNRILREFDTFTSSQKQKHEEFSNTIKEDSAEIESKITEINRSLDSLKETATGSMSAKIQEFESEFNQTLSTKSNEIDSDLAEWKHELDSKLSTLTNTYEDSRKKVEAKYLDDFKTGIEGLQTRASDQYTKMAASIEQTKNDLQDSINDIQEFVNRFKSDTDNSINSLTKASEEALRKEIENNKDLVQNSLTKLQEQMLGDLKLFEESLKTRQETGSSSIDAALAEFNTWKQQLRTQFEDSAAIFNNDLENFKSQSNDKISEEAQKLLQNMNDYAVAVQNQHNELNDKIADLENKTGASIKSYEEKSAGILNQMNSMYKKMLEEAKQRLEEQEETATERVESFKRDIKEAEDRNVANQSAFTLKMQDNANLIQTRLGDIEKELQDVKSNIQNYETADKMRRQLEENVAELNSSFTKLKGYSDAADKMNVQYTSILKINEEINRQLSGMEAQKNRVTTLEQQFNKMLAFSNTIDERIQSLNTTSDDLQTMEVAVRNYNDKLQYVSEQYERLEKKDEVVNRIKTDVDSQFEKLKDLEQRLTNCNRQAVSLPQEIKEVQANVDKILQSGPKITTAIGKLENLDSIITDTEKRIEALNSVQKGIQKTQLDLDGINREVSNKFKILQSMTQQDLSKKPKAKGSSINPQTNDMIRQLKREGWRITEIAEKLNLTENEVDLVLQLPE